jgi:predicted O-methyltransferase YrrM
MLKRSTPDKNDAIAQLVGDSQQFDFVFHDNGHSGVRDFAQLLPLMPPGAVFVLDDIN